MFLTLFHVLVCNRDLTPKLATQSQNCIKRHRICGAFLRQSAKFTMRKGAGTLFCIWKRPGARTGSRPLPGVHRGQKRCRLDAGTAFWVKQKPGARIGSRPLPGGGDGEIRTLETLLTPTRFPVVRPRPARRHLQNFLFYAEQLVLYCEPNLLSTNILDRLTNLGK